MFSDADFAYMQRAIVLAEHGLYTTTPNPRVGCVLVKNGKIIGEGFTQPAGKAHAEIQALNDARAHGHDPHGATAYVSLEPCSHIGRTPPCAQALIDAQIKRVVAAMQDPNPLVAGRGFAMLRAAHIEVQCSLLEQAAQELNLGFISRMTRQRPWVRLKVAASLDGRTALPNGVSQWITGAAARTDGHHWRARACALLTGIGTVRTDNPQLTVRDVETARQPQRILIDSQLEIPVTARLLDGAPLLIICATAEALDSSKAEALRQRGAEIIALGTDNKVTNPANQHEASNARVNLPALLNLLAARGINELHVEAGNTLNGAFLQQGCVDELLVYLAPTVLGQAIGMFNLVSPTSLAGRKDFSFHSVERVGEDLRIIARLPNHGISA